MTSHLAQHLAARGWYVQLVREDTRMHAGPYATREEAARRAAMAHRFAPGVGIAVAVVRQPDFEDPKPDAAWYLCGWRPDGVRCVSGPFIDCQTAADHAVDLRASVPGIAPGEDFSLYRAAVSAEAAA
jgi:hypothetical protein